MKGGGGGTSRHGRHDVGTPELSFKYILQGLINISDGCVNTHRRMSIISHLEQDWN